MEVFGLFFLLKTQSPIIAELMFLLFCQSSCQSDVRHLAFLRVFRLNSLSAELWTTLREESCFVDCRL